MPWPGHATAALTRPAPAAAITGDDGSFITKCCCSTSLIKVRSAKAQGIDVKDRGRVPAELVVKFKAATEKQDPGSSRSPVLRRLTHMPKMRASPTRAFMHGHA